MKKTTSLVFSFFVCVFTFLSAMLLLDKKTTFTVEAADQSTCEHTNGWTKIEGNDLSSYPVDNATQYCFKAGSDNSQGCTGGLFSSIPTGGFVQPYCGLSHWAYFVPEGEDLEDPGEEETPTEEPSPTPTNEPEASPTPTPSPTPEASSTPTPTPSNNNSGKQSKLSNDNLQCTSSEFEVIMDLLDNGNGVKDVEVTFSFNGSEKKVKTNDSGRARTSFGRSAGVVSAKADGFDSQTMTIDPPQCSVSGGTSGGQVLGATTGKVLGATTLAATGSSIDALAQVGLAFGLILTIISGYGYYRLARETSKN